MDHATLKRVRKELTERLQWGGAMFLCFRFDGEDLQWFHQQLADDFGEAATTFGTVTRLERMCRNNPAAQERLGLPVNWALIAADYGQPVERTIVSSRPMKYALRMAYLDILDKRLST